MNEPQREATVVVPALPDKLGNPVGQRDYVLVAHNGPYLNFGLVWRVQVSPRVALELMEAYQPENDPNRPFEVRRQSICSGHRVVRLDPGTVPIPIRDLLRTQSVHTGDS